MAILDQCAGSDEVFRAIGKSKDIMDQIDKTSINDKSSSYVKIYFQLITSFLKDLHLCRIWDFCHAKSFYTLRNGYLGWDDIVENQSVNISKILAFVLNNKYFVMLSSQKKVYGTISSHKMFILTVMQMQAMHVAVNMCYHILHKGAI